MYNQNTDEISDFASFKLLYKQILDLHNEDTSEWKCAEGDDYVYLYVPEETAAGVVHAGEPPMSRHSILIDEELKVKIESTDEEVDVSLAEGEPLASYSQLLTVMYVLTEPSSYEKECTQEEEWLENDVSQQECAATVTDTPFPKAPEGESTVTAPNAKKFKCSYCPKTFVRPVRAREHENVHTGRKPYACSNCSRAFSASSELFAHRQLHHGVQNHTCPDCGKKFHRKRNMRLHHKLVHLREKPYACPICHRPYTDYTCFKRHIQGHAEGTITTLEKKVACISNATKFPKEVKLRKAPSHRPPNPPKPPGAARRKRNTLPKRHPCELCGLMFARRRNVEYHVKYTHTGIKPHECEFCGKKYSDITSFKRHISGHTEQSLQQQASANASAGAVAVGDEILGQCNALPNGTDRGVTVLHNLTPNTVIPSYIILNSVN